MHNINFWQQIGFRNDKSCTCRIIKSFDIINHEMFIDKVSIWGHILKLTKSFPSNRTYSIKLNDVNSEPLEVQTGLPQGSILGAVLLVNIHINDLSWVVPWFI